MLCLTCLLASEVFYSSEEVFSIFFHLYSAWTGAFVLVSPIESGASDKVCWSVDALLRPQDIKSMKKSSIWPAVFESVAQRESGESQDAESESESEFPDENTAKEVIEE